MTTRAQKLQKLSLSLPQKNQQLAQGQQQARQIQLQEQIKQANPYGGPQVAQQMGAQQAQQAGKIQLESQQKGQQQSQMIGQMGLEQQARAQRETGAQQQLALGANQRDTANRLAGLSSGLENQLLNDQLQFQRDQAGQTVMNDRQLMDYAALKSRNAEEYSEYAQAANQMAQREIQLLEASYRKISQALNQNYIKKGKPLDQALRKELAEKKQATEKAIQKKKNAAANRSAMFRAGGAILGAVVGTIAAPGAGTAAGATAGASIGEGLGSIAAGI
jgi:hypothetical protein